MRRRRRAEGAAAPSAPPLRFHPGYCSTQYSLALVLQDGTLQAVHPLLDWLLDPMRPFPVVRIQFPQLQDALYWLPVAFTFVHTFEAATEAPNSSTLMAAWCE